MEKSKNRTFNHGYLCEMLRAANDEQLSNVVKDVKKIQEQRKNARKEILIINLKSAINAIIDAGYTLTISTTGEIENPDCIIHSNNKFLTNIAIEEEEDE